MSVGDKKCVYICRSPLAIIFFRPGGYLLRISRYDIVVSCLPPNRPFENCTTPSVCLLRRWPLKSDFVLNRKCSSCRSSQGTPCDPYATPSSNRVAVFPNMPISSWRSVLQSTTKSMNSTQKSEILCVENLKFGRCIRGKLNELLRCKHDNAMISCYP